MISSVNGVSFADYLAAIRARQTQHATIAFPNQNITLDENRIGDEGIEYQLLLNYEEDLTIGLAPCAMVHLYLLNYDGDISSIDFTDEFTVSLGVEISNGATPPVYTNVPQTIGHFIGQKPQKVYQKIIELTGYDRMILFEKSAEGFFSQEAYGKTAAQYFADLCSYVGVPAKAIPNHAVNSTKYFEFHPTTGVGMTCRTVLAYLAELMGCYARIAMDGECELVWFENHTSDYTMQRNDQMEEPDLAEYTVPVIDKYQVKITEKDVGVIVGSGTNGYLTVDNPFLYGSSDNDIRPYATNIYNKLNAFSAYKPGTFEVDGTWLIEPLDIISAVLENGSTIAFPIFNVSFIWTGNANISYNTTGNEKRPELTAENRGRLEEGYKFHELQVDIDTLSSIIGDREGHTTTITQEVDSIALIAESKNRIFVSYNDPRLTGTVNERDMWAKQEFYTWQKILDEIETWGDLNDGRRSWATISIGETYLFLNNEWVRISSNYEALTSIDELKEKYDIRSGIEIEPEGIEISGGRYIKMKSGSELNVESGGEINIQSGANLCVEAGGGIDIQSGADINIQSGGGINIQSGGSMEIGAGGTLDVNSNNFVINSQEREMICDGYTFGQNGIIKDWTEGGKEITFKITGGFTEHFPDQPYRFCGLYSNIDHFLNEQHETCLLYTFCIAFRDDWTGGEQGWKFSYIALTGEPYLETLNHPDSDGWGMIGQGNKYFRSACIKSIYYANLYQTSSRKIKHDIAPMLSVGDKLDKLQPVTFIYNSDKEAKIRQGLIYEDTINVLPEICTENEEKAINYNELIPMLLKEIQDLRARVKALEEREVK